MLSRTSFLLKVITGCLLVVLISCSDDEDSNANVNTSIQGAGSSTASLLGLISPQALGGSPTSMLVKFYGLAVSTNTDCSSPQLVFDISSSPQTYDMYANPTIFSGNLSNGTYECVIMRISDNLRFTVDSAAVAAHPSYCVDTSTIYTTDIYRSGESGWKNLDGNSITAHGSASSPVEDIVEIYASTDTSAAIAIGKSPNQVITLTSALTLPGSTTFFVDFNNGIDDHSGSQCWLEEGSFGFR